MRGPQQLQPEEEEVQWVGGEELHEREAGGEEEEEEGQEGCWNIRRKVLKGRQLRLPASFPRAASLPRRFARSITPSPAREPEAVQDTSTDLNNTQSSLNVRGSKKRAASTSPARNEFRRSLKERLPRQLRSLLARSGPGSKLPPKPTRKAGPVGRTWVKVYDDITYMDDSAEDYSQTVGYSGTPFKIPDASPLPTPPTPPPARQNFVAMKGSPTPSQKSEYDNVPREEPKKELDVTQQLSSSDQELILREISKQQQRNEANEVNVEQERPTARKRENTRYRSRRQKRSPTPVANEGMTNGYHDTDISESQTSPSNQTFETIMYDHGQTEKLNVVEDDYIVPERSISPPPRPKRGMKIYETVSPQEPAPIQVVSDAAAPPPSEKEEVTEVCEVASATEVAAEVVAEKEAPEGTVEAQEEQVQAQPVKPVRGVKLYESVVLAPKESALSTEKSVEQDEPSKREEEIVETPETVTSPEVPLEEVTVPSRPKRGVKLYEDVLPTTKTEVEKENVPPVVSKSSELTSIPTEQSPPMPSKPARGHKLYSSLNFENEPNKAKGNSEVAENINSVSATQDKPKPAERAPPYAQVHKGRDNQLKQVSSTPSDVDAPPPIPPKKRSRQTASTNETQEQMPPRPSRHLKPRSRSTDVMSTSKRQKTEPGAINGAMEPALIDTEAPPQKPSRNSANKTSAPPRRKKPVAGGDPMIARMIIDTGKVSQVTLISDGDADCYENVTLRGETKINFRSRPLPPTPVPDKKEGETSINESSVPTASTMTSACPAVTPVASATSSVAGLSAGASAGSESVRVEGAEPSSVDTTQHVSTADATLPSGCVARVSAEADAHDGKLEQDIDVNLKNIETSFATLDTVLKSLKSYSGPSPTLPRKSFDTSELIAAVENETASVGSHVAVDSSELGQSAPDKDGDLFVVSATDVCASEPSEQTCSKEGNSVKSVPEIFQGQPVSESASQVVAISTECAQKEVAAVEVVNVQPVVVGDSTQTADSTPADVVQPSDVPQDTKQSASENKVLPEAVSAVTVTVDQSQSVNESVVINDVPEPIPLNSETVASGRRLSIASENFTPDDSFVTVESISVPQSSDTATPSQEGGRRVSVAAETVVLEFMPESAQNLTESTESEIPEPISLSSEVVAPGRRLSIAAENITADLEESFVTVESIPVPQASDTVTSAPDTTTEEGGRKISVAAETVVLEFLPESAQTIADSADQTAEIAAIVPSDDAEAVSVAAVSVTVGEFADTVTNTSNDTKNSSVATESVEENELSQPQSSIVTVSSNAESTEQIDATSTVVSSQENAVPSPLLKEDSQCQNTPDVPAISSSADETLTNEGSETGQLSAPNSLEGSQTSITDEESVVSVVTKEELAARELEDVAVAAASSVDTEPSSTETKATPELVEISADSSVPAEKVQDESFGLADGVSSISNQLEGINSFLDSLVRNFSSPTESGPLEETPAAFDQQSAVADADQLPPCPTSNQSCELIFSVSSSDGSSCITNPAPANVLSSSIVSNTSCSSSDLPLSSPEDEILNATKLDASQSNMTLDTAAATCSDVELEAPASGSEAQAIGSSVPTGATEEGTEFSDNAVPTTSDPSPMDATPSLQTCPSIFPTEVEFKQDSEVSVVTPGSSATPDEVSTVVTPKKKISFVGIPPAVSTVASPTLADECDRMVTTVVTVPPPDTVFTMLNRGFGIPDSESQAPGFITVFIDGEWVRL